MAHNTPWTPAPTPALDSRQQTGLRKQLHCNSCCYIAILAASQTGPGLFQLTGSKLIEKKPQVHAPWAHRFSASSGNSLKLHCLELEGRSRAVWIMTPCWEFLSRSLRNERISWEKNQRKAAWKISRENIFSIWKCWAIEHRICGGNIPISAHSSPPKTHK